MTDPKCTCIPLNLETGTAHKKNCKATTDPKVDPKLIEILETILHKFENYCYGDYRTGKSKPQLTPEQATQALLEWAEGLCREARIDELYRASVGVLKETPKYFANRRAALKEKE